MSNNAKTREPLFHVVKRTKSDFPFWKSALIRVLAIVFGLIVCGIITFIFTKLNPIDVYKAMLNGAFGFDKVKNFAATSDKSYLTIFITKNRNLWSFLQNSAILLCISLAVTPAFKMKFWNIGAEGQVLIGGLATASCMILYGDKLPPIALFPLMIICSLAASAIWGVIPAIFKAFWNTNETLFTLMLNYVALQLVSYFCYIWSNPKGSGKIGVINQATEAGYLPTLGDNPIISKYLFNILVVIGITIFMYVYLKSSKHGYELSVVGESENTAKYIGVNVKKVIIRTMILSGAICGIAGFLLVSGTDHTVATDTAAGRGFTAIMVSWLAKFNPFAMILTSFLLVFLEKGAGEISTQFGLNKAFSEIITGIILFFIIGSEFFVNYKIMFREKEEK